MVEEDIRKITGVITAVTPILERLNRKDSLAKIQERIRQIQNTEVKVLICGEFKRGKSSFVNALIGRNICPVDQDICTSVVSIIRYGDTERVIRYFGDLSHVQKAEIPYADIQKYTVGRAEQVQNTLYLEIELPLECLKNGLVLIDTPGVGGLDPRHAFLTTYFLPQADITLFMTDVNEPLTTTELDFYNQKVTRYAKHSAIIINKCDLKTPEQVVEVQQDTVQKIQNHASTSKEPNVIAVSSKFKQAFNQTHVEKMYEKSHFSLIDSELQRLMIAYKEDIIRNIRDDFSDLLEQVIEPIKIQLTQIKMPDPKVLTELKQKETIIQKQLYDLNNPSSEFRIKIQQKITEVREEVINHLNEQSILFSSSGLNKLLQSEQATKENGGKWIGQQLNLALESLGAEIVLELRHAFDRISRIEEFQGMLKYQVKDFSYSIMEVNAENEVPIHRRLMSLVPGMGAGFATNLVVGSLASFFGFGLPLLIPIAVGLGIAAKSHSDTVRASKIAELREQYQPQITVAMQQLRTFVESRFTEFQQVWIKVVSQRVQEVQTTLQALMADLNKLSQNQKTILSRKMELERLMNPLVTQKHMIDLILSNPFQAHENKEEKLRQDPNETIC